jgi:transposase-like protein
MARACTLALSAEEAHGLLRISKASTSTQAKAFRSRIVLRCAEPDDPTNWQVAVELDCDPDTVSKWRRRFAERRLDGLEDLPRPGAPRTFSP